MTDVTIYVVVEPGGNPYHHVLTKPGGGRDIGALTMAPPVAVLLILAILEVNLSADETIGCGLSKGWADRGREAKNCACCTAVFVAGLMFVGLAEIAPRNATTAGSLNTA